MSKTHLVIIGFGNQAKAWALNLRDSGVEVIISLRKNSPSIITVKKMGLKFIELGPDIRKYENFALLTPDHTHKDILECYAKHIKKTSRIIYAHGYSCTGKKIDKIYSEFKHILLAPKAIASEVRFQYESKGKLAACYCLGINGTNEDLNFIQALAKDLGITSGPHQTTFEEETFADLFSEQTILCSLIPYGALHSFNALRKKGVRPELAYLECWLEVKLIADTMVKLGPDKFFTLISPNALIGGQKGQKLLFDEEYQKKLQILLTDVWSGKFFDEVEKTDPKALQKEVNDFWKNQELTKVHHQLKNDLFVL